MTAPPWTRERLLQTSNGYWLSCLLHAAVELGLFAHLGDEAHRADRIAAALGTDPDATERLLEALTATGILREDQRSFRNTPVSRSCLCPDGADYVGDMLIHHHLLMDSWNRLDEAVRTGKPVRTSSSFGPDKSRDTFLKAMANSAAALAPQVAAILPLKNHRRLLDLGGGPGTYAVRFCHTHTELSGVIFDLPTSRHLAEETIRQGQVEDRLKFWAGNYLADPIPGEFDLIWMSHILHAESREDARMLLEKAARALVPGGLIVIQEFVLHSDCLGPLFSALFSLNMLLGTPGGRAYREKELMDMMAQAGLKDLQRLELDGAHSALILGHRGRD